MTQQVNDRSTMSDEFRELSQMLERVFAEQADEASRVPTSMELDRALWQTLSELGLTQLTGNESSGGSAAGWHESALLFTAAGRAAARVPLAENDVLAGWLLDTAGIAFTGNEIRTAAIFDRSGCARGVPWARAADKIVVLWENTTVGVGSWTVADLPRASFDLAEDVNLAGEPRDHLRIDLEGLEAVPVDPSVPTEFRLRAALSRTLLATGAAERILDLMIEHANTRVQFGRLIAKFQAVQALIADTAAEASLIQAAADAAVAIVEKRGFSSSETVFAIAAAKSTAGHSISTVVRNAHQVLGAIGFTYEHELHHHTTRALSWRSEYGSVSYWDNLVAETAISDGSSGLWSEIVDGLR